MNFQDQFKNYSFPLFGMVRLPAITVTAQEYKDCDTKESVSNAEFLRRLVRQGFKSKVPKQKYSEYGQRCETELSLLEELGFTDYVLLVWKITSFCDREAIARDYGRGSACGSLIFYLIGATKVDPIPDGLYFERFVSRARAKSKIIDGITYIDGSLSPDVDIDIEQTKRVKVIEYLQSLYPGKVCKISTFSTLSGKSLIKDAGKVIAEKTDEEMKMVAGKIEKKYGIVQDIEEAYAGTWNKEKNDWKVKPSEDFKKWCDENPLVYKIALKLRDLIKNRGSHPSGFVVSYDPIIDFLPLGLTSKMEAGNDEGKLLEEKEVAVTFAMDQVANLAIKLDLLGVRCCSVVAEVLTLSGEKEENINIENDPIIYDNLQNLKLPHGIFQIEAPTNLRVCRQVKPKNKAELSDVIAMARPGALAYVDNYINGDAEKLHPIFDKILKSTNGVCLYQETLMQLANAVGFTLEESEILRRIVGKKKRDEVVEWQKKIREKVKENNLPESLGDLLWKIAEESSAYSFNKCLAPDTIIETQVGNRAIRDIKVGDKIKAYDTKNRTDHFVEVKDKMLGTQLIYEMTTESGKKLRCSQDHKILCSDGIMRPLKELVLGDEIVCSD